MGRKRKLTQSEMENLRTTGWRDGVSKTKTKVYPISFENFDADMALLEAVGIARSHWSPRDTEKRLSYLEMCVKHDVVPDAQGRRWKPGAGPARRWKPGHGRYGYVYAGVPVPEHLQHHMEGLADAIGRCRKALAGGNDGDAAKQIDSINKLVSEICRVTLDHRMRAPQATRAKRGRETIADQTAPDRKALLEYMTEYEKRLGTDSPTAIARAMLRDEYPWKVDDKKAVEKLRGRIRRAKAAEE